MVADLVRWFFLSGLPRGSGRRLAWIRGDIERVLHDDVAIGMSALTVELELIARAASDPVLGARIEAARDSVCRLVDDVRRVGAMIYPPVLRGVGDLGATLLSVAERLGLRLRLDLPRYELATEAKVRAGLFVADLMYTLSPQTTVAVRVRGRNWVRVRVTKEQA